METWDGMHIVSQEKKSANNPRHLRPPQTYSQLLGPLNYIEQVLIAMNNIIAHVLARTHHCTIDAGPDNARIYRIEFDVFYR